MAEDKATKSKRDMALERVRTKHPGVSFDDDESLFGQINDDYDSYDNEIAKYKEEEGKFSDMFTSNPRTARLLMEWRDGEDPAVALVRLYGEDIADARDDPKKQEAIAAANKEYMERVAKEKEYDEDYNANLQQTLADLEEIQSDGKYSDDQIDSAMEWLLTIIRDGVMGKFSPETINMAIKAQNFDTAVEEASQEGEVRGRNSKIEEKLRKPGQGDGTAPLDGKNGGGRSRRMPDLGVLDHYTDGNQTIFERGGEKRIRRREA